MNAKAITTMIIALVAMIGLTGLASAYGTATVEYSGTNGDFTIHTQTANVYDIQTCSFDGTVFGYQTSTESGPSWRGDDSTTIERITTTTGASSIGTNSYITTPCPWDEDGRFVADVTTDTFAQLSQLGSAQGRQNSHQQPHYLQFGTGTATGVTDLRAEGEYEMNLEVIQFVPGQGGPVEAASSVNAVGVTNSQAYLGSARMQLGDGYGCHGTGFNNYYPGYSNELPGFVVSDPDGVGTVELTAFEGAAVWGAPYLQVQTTVSNDGVDTVTDVNTATGYVYQAYTYENEIYGEGHMLAH